MDHLHRKTGSTTAWPNQEIDFFSEYQVFYFSSRYINLCLSVPHNNIQFSPEDTTFGIDLIQRNLDSFNSCFGVHMTASGEVINNPDLNGVLRCWGCSLCRSLCWFFGRGWFSLSHDHGD